MIFPLNLTSQLLQIKSFIQITSISVLLIFVILKEIALTELQRYHVQCAYNISKKTLKRNEKLVNFSDVIIYPLLLTFILFIINKFLF